MNNAQAAAGGLPEPMPWQQDTVAKLTEQGLPQALMVLGRMGDGLERLCLHLAMAELANNDPHGQQMLKNDTHPDLHVLRLQESSTGKLRKHIVISQVREMIEVVHLTPVQGAHRYVVIIPACHLNRNAANALLKLLEEPPSTVKLILGVERADWLPATIRSRCSKATSGKPSTEQALSWLGNDLKDPAKALDMAAGAPLDASSCVEYAPAMDLLEQYCTSAKMFVDGQSKLDRLEPAIWLPWAISWAVDGSRLANNIEPLHPQLAKVPQSIHARHKPSALAWLNLYVQLLEMYALTSHPVVNRLLLERTVFLFNNLAHDAH